MKKVDFKSMVIGLLLGVCMLLVLGSSGQNDDVANIGRYQISTLGDSKYFFMLVDTTDGRTWEVKTSSPSGWAYMGKPDNEGK